MEAVVGVEGQELLLSGGDQTPELLGTPQLAGLDAEDGPLSQPFEGDPLPVWLRAGLEHPFRTGVVD